ncbi:MAG TPA: 16S rRNA (guanine(527)-N(7))-methyltransferase RsmG [Candidatus Cloacimonetes bacterium]|nr:16S rRNA (guanine(527)-N(7))-methyltransferase RsmG [Candidatus Cloacimonadota bacterium]
MKVFESALSSFLGVFLSPRQKSLFSKYLDLLLEWNKKINLTSITDTEEIWFKHFLDSLTCLRVIRPAPLISIVDIGTGAGFPGIPLKIMLPGVDLLLVESVEKKSGFCQFIVENLKLDHVTVLNARAETVGSDCRYREHFDWAVSRAVASLPVLAEYQLPLVKPGGSALAMKGDISENEIRSSETAFKILGGHLEKIDTFYLPGNFGKRTIIEIRKSKKTPEKYPRRIGVPSKKPLA